MTDLLMDLPVTLPVFSIAFVVTAAAATLQSTVGFGFAVASVPLLRLIDPQLAPVPQLLMIVPLAVSMAIRERASMDIQGIRWVLLGRVIGALAGWALLAIATDLVLDLSLAFIVLMAVFALAVAKRFPETQQLKPWPVRCLVSGLWSPRSVAHHWHFFTETQAVKPLGPVWQQFWSSVSSLQSPREPWAA